jgi:hypothetical protein
MRLIAMDVRLFGMGFRKRRRNALGDVLGEIADALEVGGHADRADHDARRSCAIGWRLAMVRMARSSTSRCISSIRVVGMDHPLASACRGGQGLTPNAWSSMPRQAAHGREHAVERFRSSSNRPSRYARPCLSSPPIAQPKRPVM